MKNTSVIAAVLFLCISIPINASDVVTRALFTTAIVDRSAADDDIVGRYVIIVSRRYWVRRFICCVTSEQYTGDHDGCHQVTYHAVHWDGHV